MAMKFIKERIDADKDKYIATCEKRAAAGRRGNEKRWGKKDNESQSIANIANATTESQSIANIAESDTDTDTESDTDTEREENKFMKENGYRIREVKLVKKDGTIQEVKEYEETGI